MDDEPIFQIAAGLNEPPSRPQEVNANISMQHSDSPNPTPDEDVQEEPVIEVEGTSRTGRPRKPTFRYSPDTEQPHRRRREKATTPDDKKGAAFAPDGEYVPGEDDEAEFVDDHMLDPEETGRSVQLKRARRPAGGPKPGRRGRDTQDTDKPESAVRRRVAACTGAGKARGRGRGSAVKRRRSIEKDDDAEPSGIEAKERAADEAPRKEWSSDDDRRWDQDIVQLKALFSEFCRKEDEAKAICSDIQALLTSWTQKAAPSTEVLTHTMAGKYLKSHIIRRAQEGSLLDPTYPRSVLSKWKREVAGPKVAINPADQQGAAERGPASTRTDTAKVKTASPKAPSNGDGAVTVVATAGAPKPKTAGSDGDPKPSSGSARGQATAAAKAEVLPSKPAEHSTQMLLAATKLEAREPVVHHFTGDDYRNKGLAIFSESLQPEFPHTQMAVLLEELLYQSCSSQGIPPGVEYKQGLLKIWNHLACGGESYNPRLRESLLAGRLKALDLLQMAVGDMKQYGLTDKRSAVPAELKPPTALASGG